MKKGEKGLVYLATALVVFGLGFFHAHLIGHYRFVGTGRYSWYLAYVAGLDVAAYGAGIPDVASSKIGAFWSSILCVAVAAGIISLIQLASGSQVLPRFVVFGAGLVLLPVFFLLSVLSQRSDWERTGSDRVLLVGSDQTAQAFVSDLSDSTERGCVLVARLSPDEAVPGGERGLAPIVDEAERSGATVVVLDRDAQAREEVVSQAALLHGRGIRVRTHSLFYDEWLGKIPVADLERISLMFDIQEIHAQRYSNVKRFVDVIVALLLMLVLIVLTPIVWLVDKFANPGPLMFRQPRVGMNGKEFTIVKFRTMSEPKGAEQPEDYRWTEPDDDRLRPFGRWMRRAHLDELPQVMNVLRGDLSVVGPRPEQPRYVEELRQKIPFYDFRHLVHPGLTGWAQVKFSYGASVEDALEKLQYEFFYLRHQSIVLDARIVARTIRTIVHRKGR
jgi:lipopolysaccharide/colanic/teichoic acid biosynthesis glycosyltransferase